ncbi:MAG: right-handed parallel beta-helix repeat-containing protein [Desulfuromonadaceae bacterium]|nr:right-handed parallel beta-helix repeat-containing protein [Desulfuromonadaceae bacterium]
MRKFFYRHLLVILSLLVVPILTSCLLARNISGDIDGQHIWRGTVYVDGDVELSAGSSLRILPGTEVVFLPPRAGQRSAHPFFHGSELIVRGRLIAEGTASEPIVFRSIESNAPPGAWGSVNLTESPYASFRFCRFKQADSAIHSQQSREVYIRESVFEDNLVAIRFHSTPIIIENNLIQHNGAGIRFHFDAPVINRNLIVDNEKGIFITAHPREYLIRNNHFARNNTHVVLGEEVPEDVDLTLNYWDSPDLPAALFFDKNRSSYLGTVQLLPLLPQADPSTGPSWNR